MKSMAYNYNEDFISKIRADDTVQRYPGYVKELPTLPSIFTLSYFVGVAAGVDGPPPRRINPNGGPSLFGCLELQYARHRDNQYGMRVLSLQ
ncbi:hypothetical protein MY4038_010064 [Beauveria bassiana]